MVMKLNTGKLLDDFQRATTELGLCPNRVWVVAKEDLPSLLPDPRSFARVSSKNDESAEKDNNHSSCTFDFCEYSHRDFTAVKQRHECSDQSECMLLRGRFSRAMLTKAAENDEPTVWTLSGDAILQSPRPYMTISHVWSDGTGAGAEEPGQVNECLYSFFCDIAKRFSCEGIWWDTISIPRDKAARNKAIRRIQNNYQSSRITLVHDCFLRNWGWDPQTAGFGIIMSPWFSRGWTALELAKSRKVKVIFKGPNGPIIKDLDEDILAKNDEPSGPRKAASRIIRHLRKGIVNLNDYIEILSSRYTSWPKDMATISALLTNCKPEELQQDTYRNILRAFGKLSHGHLFHNSATMANTFSWCPTTPLNMPLDISPPKLQISDEGDLHGLWRVGLVDQGLEKRCFWSGARTLIQYRLQNALHEPSQCCLLFEPDVKRSERALLALVVEDREESILRCKYVGPLYFRETQQDNGWILREVKIMGSRESEVMNVSAREDRLINNVDNLHQAVRLGNQSEFDRLIKSDRQNRPDQLGQLPLHLAAERGDEYMVQRLMALTDLEMTCYYGQTALHRAAWGGSVAIGKLLVQGGSCLTSGDYRGNLPLHIASQMESMFMVRLLLDKGTPIDSTNAAGQTSLHHSAMNGGCEIAQLLIDRGANATLPDKIGWLPLHYAAASGNTDIVRLLASDHGGVCAEINSRDSVVGWTPMHLAAMTGAGGAISTLLKHNAENNLKDSRGWTAWHFATINGHREIVRKLPEDDESPDSILKDSTRVLWQHCISMNKTTFPITDIIEKETELAKDGMSSDWLPYDFAIRHGLKTTALRLGKLETSKEHHGHYAAKLFSVAVQSGQNEMAQLFLDHHVELARTPSLLALAAVCGRLAVVQMLLDKGVNVHESMALPLACRVGRLDVVEALISAGADMNRMDTISEAVLGANVQVEPLLHEHNGIIPKKATPMSFAARGGHDDVVTFLLDKGAGINAADDVSALAEAAECGHITTVQLLISKGSKINGLNAALLNGHTKIAEMLFDREEFLRDRLYGHHALENAARGGHVDAVKMLLDRGVRPQNISALIAAVEGAYEAIVKLILDKFTDDEERLGFVSTLLSTAAQEEQVSILNYLLGEGADIDYSVMYGYSAMYTAASRGLTATVKFLIEKNANVNREGSVIIAAQNGHRATVEVLLEAGAYVNPKMNYNIPQDCANHMFRYREQMISRS